MSFYYHQLILKKGVLGLNYRGDKLKNNDRFFSRPHWLVKEVTEEKKYYNNNLSKHPHIMGKEASK